MTKSSLAWKVGLFVIICLICLAALIMKFSKTGSFFEQTYDLYLKTSNVGGIRVGAPVLMAGVPIGRTEDIRLDQDGRAVTIHVKILHGYDIYSDALFMIQQVGFLGDQLISIIPQQNTPPILKDDSYVRCEEPFNLAEVARSAASLLIKADQTAQKLNDAVARIDRTLLAESNLTNITGMIANFRLLSARALVTLHGVDQLVQTNIQPMSVAVSNLVEFSSDLNVVANELQLTVATNRVELTQAIQNIESATIEVNKILGGLQQGRGVIGSLLKDEQLDAELHQTIRNLSLLSSNLNRHGLLWKPKLKKTNVVWQPAYPGKNPVR